MRLSGRAVAIGLVLTVGIAVGVVGAWRWFFAPPSILLITIDTLRPDRLGCYGHPTNKTPAIDRLGREGTIFERAYCDTPWTTASMASVMTGLYPAQHGLRSPTEKLSTDMTTMAELLRSHGFQTGAVIGSFPLDSVYGLDRGFETYDDEFSMPMFADPDATVTHIESELPSDPKAQSAFILEKMRNDAYRPDEDVTTAAIRWLDGLHKSQPFFLWVHYFGPHDKLAANRSFVEQEPDIIAAYDADVESNDRAVGRLLDHVRQKQLLERTMVVLHADHGQNLGENDYVGHGKRLDEESVRIPLIVRYPPKMPRGARLDVASNIDILPTALDVTRIAPPPTLQGRSLVPSRRAKSESENEPFAYFETFIPKYFHVPVTVPNVGAVLGPTELHGVRAPQWKLVEQRFVGPCARGSNPHRDGFGAWSLQDPVPLSAEECAGLDQTHVSRGSSLERYEPPANVPLDVLTTLRANLERSATSTRPGAEKKFQLSPEQQHKLKSLGYLQ